MQDMPDPRLVFSMKVTDSRKKSLVIQFCAGTKQDQQLPGYYHWWKTKTGPVGKDKGGGWWYADMVYELLLHEKHDEDWEEVLRLDGMMVSNAAPAVPPGTTGSGEQLFRSTQGLTQGSVKWEML